MKKFSYKYYILFLGIVLFIVTSLVIVTNGRYITVKYDVSNISTDINDYKVSIEQDKDIISIVDKKINGNYLEIKYKSKSRGKAFISINEHF